MRRTGFAVRVNAALAVSAVARSLDFIGSRGWRGLRQGLDRLLPIGPVRAMAGGRSRIDYYGTGVGVGVKAWKGTLKERLALSGGARRRIMPMGRLGFSARGGPPIVGGFLALAALHADPSEAKGLPVRLERYRRNHSVGCYSVSSYSWVCSRLERSSLWSPTTVELMRLSQKRLVERLRAVAGLRHRRLEGE